MLRIVPLLLLLVSCTTDPPNKVVENAKETKFFECLKKLGPNQAQGIHECERQL